MKTHDENMNEINASNAHRYCWYEPGKAHLCDMAMVNPGGVPVGRCTGDTIEVLRKRYSNAELFLFDDASAAIDKAQEVIFKRPPVEITEARFIEMLEVLPPENWERAKNSESFKLCEHTCGMYTSIFARVGGRYFELCDYYTTLHGVIINKVVMAFPDAGSVFAAGKRMRHLDCAVCGGDAPSYVQWHNRDTGYGCCPSCFRDAVAKEGEAEAVSHYGVTGIHHSVISKTASVQTETVETPIGEQLDGGGEVET